MLRPRVEVGLATDVMIEAQQLTKMFGNVRALDRVSFKVKRGEVVGFLGPNGAGKSTLFNLITGNIRADAGTITLVDRDVTRVSPMERCLLGVGRSFQIPQPFASLTVFENLVVAATHGRGLPEREVTGDCLRVLEQTDLLDRANQTAGSLSLLARKRLELARAMSTGPKLLLLDEIAGGLTEVAVATEEAVAAMRAIGASIGTLDAVAHDIGDAMAAQDLATGEIAQAGSAATLLVLGRREVCGSLAVQGFAREYRLSPSEEQVLAALCEGLSPNEVAERHGVKIATVRTQIANLRAKTGAESIRALVKQVAVLPPLVGTLRRQLDADGLPPGMVASMTSLPVLGVPVKSSALSGLDSLLSIVQMPGGVPVGTMAIGKSGAINAALLATAILGNKHPAFRDAYEDFRRRQTEQVLAHRTPIQS
mgnify:CR=1 FL=1